MSGNLPLTYPRSFAPWTYQDVLAEAGRIEELYRKVLRQVLEYYMPRFGEQQPRELACWEHTEMALGE